jgi:hypothetical protein
MNFNDLSLAERLVAEQAVLNLQTLNTACDNAADGTVLAIAETLAVEQGRELTRKTLQMSIAAQVKTVEKKFAPPDLPVRNEEGSPRPKDSRTNDVCWRSSFVADRRQ